MHYKVFWVTCISAILMSLVVAASAATQHAEPPQTRYLVSPSGEYKLTIELTGHEAHAKLQRLIVPNETLWQRVLPHESGPRTGIVGDAGEAVLLDEWSKLFTEHAVTVLSPDGSVLRQYGTNDIAAIMNRNPADFANDGLHGTWMRGQPYFEEDSVIVPMGEFDLRINITTGIAMQAAPQTP